MKFVTDVAKHKWVIFSEKRKDYKPQKLDHCPFCPGQEDANEELYRFGTVRIITNKYPYVDLQEVIIHSPDHFKDIDELPIEQTINILKVFRERFNFHKNNGKVFIFQNHDLYAGASIPHPHSQLIVIPKEIPVEPSLREPVANIILQTDYFTAYCPEFSQWPYEVWICPVPPRHSGASETSDRIYQEDPIAPSGLQDDNVGNIFGSITDAQITDLATVLQRVLKAMVTKFEINKEMAKKGIGTEFPYNFYIYHGDNWYLRIIPRLMRHGGFELSTGLHINMVDPSIAATEFRDEITVRKN